MEQAGRHQLINEVRNYQMPEAAVKLLKKHPPLIISGATASGKSSILSYIEQSSQWRHVITHTTRAPRSGEESGKNYWFVNDSQMSSLLKDQAVVEASTVHGETIYAASIAAYMEVVNKGHKPLLVIDVQGVEKIVKRVPDLQTFFILPPSFDEWMDRLGKRGLMSHIEKERRLRSARVEMEHALQNYHFNLIVNRDVHTAAGEILNFAPNAAIQRQSHELALRLIEHARHF